jgi:NAD(P)-dependent dehydrogenase (short-subunit alcohol dehydrogenase family)
MSDREKFAGHIALVTGAGSGMGAQVSRRLAGEGAKVALLDIDIDRACATAEEVQRSGHSAAAYQCDIRSRAEVETIFDAVEADLGVPDLVVNCAGVIRIMPFLEVTDEDWDETLAVNLKGMFLITQTAARRMVVADAPGRIVAISSIAARGPRPDCADYAASKAGVISIVQAASVALARHGITVNAICPGVVDTAMTTLIHENRSKNARITPAESIARAVEKIPLGRIESTNDVANAVLFLLSAEGSYITGQALNVCGGLHFN